MPGGFEPGRTYEVSFRATQCPVAGLGLVALRDVTSWLKYPSATARGGRAPRDCVRIVAERPVPADVPVRRLQRRRAGPARLRRGDGAHRRRRAPEPELARRDAERAQHVRGDHVSLRRSGTPRSDQRPGRRAARQRPGPAASAEGHVHEQRRRILGRRPGGGARPHLARRQDRPDAAGQRARLLPGRARSIRRGASPRAWPRDSSPTTRSSTGGPCARSSWPWTAGCGRTRRRRPASIHAWPTARWCRPRPCRSRRSRASSRRTGSPRAGRARARAVPGQPGGRRRQRTRGRPGARTRRAAGDLHRLELPRAGDRRPRPAREPGRVVHPASRRPARSATRPAILGPRLPNGIRRATRTCGRSSRRPTRSCAGGISWPRMSLRSWRGRRSSGGYSTDLLNDG